METTSSPTSSEPSRWSRSTVALAAWLTIAAFLVVSAFALRATGSDGEGESDALFDYGFAAGSLVVYALIVGVTWLVARVFRDAGEALGLRRFPLRWLGIAFGLTLLAVIVSALLEPLLHAGEEQGLAPDRWEEGRAAAFALNGAVIVLVVPFAEELFFRGLGVRVLAFLGETAAVVGTAAIFALAHGILVGIPALGLFALALGWVRFRSASVWPGFAAHATYNLVGILAALYVALDDDPPAALATLF